MPETAELFRIAIFGISVGFMTTLLKKNGRESEANIINIIAMIIVVLILIGHIMNFFEVIETMMTKY